ncbi:MAG: ABC transporter ATP-binding protein [Geminicoccaceae bacterium]|nr:ABC transporter ATP-binding protein [Geminicoccaceae bacterium]
MFSSCRNQRLVSGRNGTILQLDHVVRDYRLPRQSLVAPAPVHRAVDDVSLRLAAGESLGIVGESGSGKSTLARIVAGLDQPTSGRVVRRGRVQMVFQDPYGSLDPRMNVERIVAEALHLDRETAGRKRERVVEALEAVGLSADDLRKHPHAFSGGQRQRIAIARALVARPDLVIADEPVSALDVSVQAQVLNLMVDLRQRYGMAYLLISHDLSVVAHLTDRVAVLSDGRIVEEGATRTVLSAPRHDVTKRLLDAVLPTDPAEARKRLAGDGGS